MITRFSHVALFLVCVFGFAACSDADDNHPKSPLEKCRDFESVMCDMLMPCAKELDFPADATKTNCVKLLENEGVCDGITGVSVTYDACMKSLRSMQLKCDTLSLPDGQWAPASCRGIILTKTKDDVGKTVTTVILE